MGTGGGRSSVWEHLVFMVGLGWRGGLFPKVLLPWGPEPCHCAGEHLSLPRTEGLGVARHRYA